MSAPIRIENRAWSDWRFEALGRLRYPAMDTIDARDLAHHKFCRAVALCTRLQSYELRPLELDGIGGSGFSRALVECDLGEVLESGSVRVKGTEGRIEWLQKRREASAKGGESRKKKGAEAKRKPKASPPSLSLPPDPSPDPSLSTSPATSEAHVAAPEPETPRAAPVASARWRALFETLYAEVNAGAKPSWPKEHCIAANKLLRAHGEEEVCRRTEVLFHGAPDWIARGGRDVGTLVAQWNKLARAAPGVNGRRSASDHLAIAAELDRQGRMLS